MISCRTLIGVFIGALLVAPGTYASPSPGAGDLSLMYLSDGVSREGELHMKQTARDFDLLLALKLPAGTYDYRDVHIHMTDGQGDEVLDARAEGPLFYVRVPPGHYLVTAKLRDKQILESVTIAMRQTSHLTFDWRS